MTKLEDALDLISRMKLVLGIDLTTNDADKIVEFCRGIVHRLASVDIERDRDREEWTDLMTENASLRATIAELSAKCADWPSCPHCRGEIGVILTTVAEQALKDLALAERDQRIARQAEELEKEKVNREGIVRHEHPTFLVQYNREKQRFEVEGRPVSGAEVLILGHDCVAVCINPKFA